MQCPECGDSKTRVMDSREVGSSVRRRRRCESHGHRFVTYEVVETTRPLVVKQDGARQEWDRNKLLAGVRLACTKRPISSARIEDLVNAVESELTSTGRQEIESKDIGEAVMKKLRTLDDVAYIRFASVYRRFRDAGGFLEEVERIKRPARAPDEQVRLEL